MHYKSYSSRDFVEDEFFRQWVFTPNEERDRYWSNFLKNCPAQRPNVDAAREFLVSLNLRQDVPESTIRDIRLNLNATIEEYERSQRSGAASHRIKGRSTALYRKRVYQIAAALLGFALCAVWFFSGSPFQDSNSYREVSTRNGDRSHTVLDDGTQVWLNAHSSLRFAADFSAGNTREVFLDGEAFFDVAEDKSKPFLVHASGVVIKVLGTAFNVLAYADGDAIETTLVRGKVDIARAGDDRDAHVTLLPNERAIFDKQTQKIGLEKSLNVDDYVAWKDGSMIFDNRPFGYIKQTMERWYDVTIEMEDESSMSCRFTARFKNMTLQEVLEIFKKAAAVNYRLAGDRVFISGKLCQDKDTQN
jgi:ferric-dicitrate binding protein FerR (iron transport regulator)